MAAGIVHDISVFFIFFFSLCCFHVTWGEPALDCCLKVSQTKIPTHIVRGYKRQIGGNGCDISAVVFTTRKGYNLCSTPGILWVETLTAHLDKEKRRCQDSAFKNKKRCRTLRF